MENERVWAIPQPMAGGGCAIFQPPMDSLHPLIAPAESPVASSYPRPHPHLRFQRINLYFYGSPIRIL